MGPYVTEDQAAAEPMPQHVDKLTDRDARHAAKLDALHHACHGIPLGHYDRQVLHWLAGWEATVVQVVADLIARQPPRCPEPGA